MKPGLSASPGCALALLHQLPSPTPPGPGPAAACYRPLDNTVPAVGGCGKHKAGVSRGCGPVAALGCPGSLRSQSSIALPCRSAKEAGGSGRPGREEASLGPDTLLHHKGQPSKHPGIQQEDDSLPRALSMLFDFPALKETGPGPGPRQSRAASSSRGLPGLPDSSRLGVPGPAFPRGGSGRDPVATWALGETMWAQGNHSSHVSEFTYVWRLMREPGGT